MNIEINNNKYVYSVFSGTVFQIPEKDLKFLKLSHIPLKQSPKKSCSKCYGRFYTGRDAQNFSYIPCSCIRKIVDFDIYSVDIKEKFGKM